jgi:glycosyltransferase involved in cell wall biosynthesis
MHPRISIVTPSCRAASLIEDTLQSVLQQRYPNLEYIVMDGAGDTDTADVIRRHAADLAYWCSEPDDGPYDAINQAFVRSTGEILCWLNAGDILLPRSLFLVAKLFATFGDVHWITTLRPGLLDANGYIASVASIPGCSREGFLDGLNLPGVRATGHFIQQESTFWRRGLWERSGARIPPYPMAGDFALWAEFYKHAELYGVDYPLACFRRIEGQRSENIAQYKAEARDVLERLRAHCAWAESDVNALRYDRPRLRRMLATGERGEPELVQEVGYSGRRIRNRAVGSVGAHWSVEPHWFLP